MNKRSIWIIVNEVVHTFQNMGNILSAVCLEDASRANIGPFSERDQIIVAEQLSTVALTYCSSLAPLDMLGGHVVLYMVYRRCQGRIKSSME